MPAPSETQNWRRRGGALALTVVAATQLTALAQPTPQQPASRPPVTTSQPPAVALPNDEDMARALQARPMPTPERLATQPLRSIPRVGADAAAPVQPGSLDLAAMARQGASLQKAPDSAASASALRIFITLDMPRESLRRLVEQASKTGATLVLRGLKSQSMRQTAAAAAALIEGRSVSWVIDPDAFTRFRVSGAPSFVLSLVDDGGTARAINQGPNKPTQCTASGCATPADPTTFLSLSGDVSLDYALQTMLRHSPQAAPRLSALMGKLRTP